LNNLINNIMNDFILNTANEIGIFYVFFVATLLVVNSIAKLAFDTEAPTKTRKIIMFSSFIIFFAFWIAGGKLRYLVLYTFFAFGFYDFIGRYVEKGIVLLMFWINKNFKKFKLWFKSLFDFRLFNK